MRLSVTWSALEAGLLAVAEGGTDRVTDDVLAVLGTLGLVANQGSVDLSPVGERYYLARFVAEDRDAQASALSDLLSGSSVATAFCSALWSGGAVPIAGAVSLLKRLRAGDDHSAKRWLDLMNRAGWVKYNKASPTVRIIHNPSELVSPREDIEREQGRGHVIAPDTPFGNLLALRELLRSARSFIRWYEQHMPLKVLEVLYREVQAGDVAEIRLLSGPANINGDTKDEFKRFAIEMKAKRSTHAEWRVLSKKDAFLHHDRFFVSDGIARNLPPLNTILKGSTGEILPSDLTKKQFDEWWDDGEVISSFTVPQTA